MCVPVYLDTDLPETIPRVLPRRNAQNIQHLRGSAALAIYLDDDPHFFTNNLLVHFQGHDFYFGLLRSPRILTRFASKIAEVVGRDTIISLDIEAREINPPDGMWEVLLHGLPQLERICYDHIGEEDGPLANSFVLVFSRLFEGSPVCPRLQRLELPKGMLT